MNDISPELVERMAQLIRELSSEPRNGSSPWFHHWYEACKIVGLLPVPVDPDEKEVRRIAFADGVMISDKAVSLIVAYFSNRPAS